MRASGIVTHSAAKLMIIEYLHQRPDMNYEMMSQYDKTDHSKQKRRLSKDILDTCNRVVRLSFLK